MARIELFPVVVGGRALDDPEEGARLAQSVIDADAAWQRLAPVMRDLGESRSMVADPNVWTDADMTDLVTTLRPFMAVAAEEARYILSTTDLAEWFDAFMRARRLIEQALIDTVILRKRCNCMMEVME